MSGVSRAFHSLDEAESEDHNHVRGRPWPATYSGAGVSRPVRRTVGSSKYPGREVVMPGLGSWWWCGRAGDAGPNPGHHCWSANTSSRDTPRFPRRPLPGLLYAHDHHAVREHMCSVSKVTSSNFYIIYLKLICFFGNLSPYPALAR